MPNDPDLRDVGVARCCSRAGFASDLRFGWWILVRRGGVLPAALDALAVAVHLDDVDVVGEAFRPKDLGPLVEGEVGGDQDGAPCESLHATLMAVLPRANRTEVPTRDERLWAIRCGLKSSWDLTVTRRENGALMQMLNASTIRPTLVTHWPNQDGQAPSATSTLVRPSATAAPLTATPKPRRYSS